MKVGDLIRDKTGRFCGIERQVVFWDYEGILIKMFEVPEYVPDLSNPFTTNEKYKPARMRGLVYRNNDPKDWFYCDMDDMEVVC